VDADLLESLLRTFSAISRRTALAGLLDAALAAQFGRIKPHATDARNKRRKKKKCKGNRKKCGKKCIPKTECCGGCGDRLCCEGTCAECCVETDCPVGGACVEGACICFAEDVVCAETCVDLASATANCGACGVACTVGDCIHGACQCIDATDCPGNGCVCAERNEGGNACSRGTTEQTCSTDDECPVGSFCLLDVQPRCSAPCLG
jgi:hypothetical protein